MVSPGVPRWNPCRAVAPSGTHDLVWGMASPPPPSAEELARTNPIFRLLRELRLVDVDRLEVFHSRTRDAEIRSLRDPESGVIFLEELRTGESHYVEKEGHATQRAEVVTREGRLELDRVGDLPRRVHLLQPLVEGRHFCDFGGGPGHLAEACLPHARRVSNVELNENHRRALATRVGDRVGNHPRLEDLPEPADVVAAMHVLEHLDEPLPVLKSMKEAVRPGGTLVVEVPHARDFLLLEMGLTSYRDFSLWSEHLLLHTRESLRHLLEAAGFVEVTVEPLQRYGFANHLHWLRHGRPGGHTHFAHLSSPELDAAYAARLGELDRSDTLLATARSP